jgi:hypothetical protein
MKSTESLDDTGKLVVLSSATGETATSGDTSIIENKRRRLVRGAVAFAPLVLTLRSGALAAASCTGTVAFVNINDAGTITNNPVPNGVAADQICVSGPTTDMCPAGKISSGSRLGKVTNIGTSDKPVFTCGSGPTQQVAILSSASATSLKI